MKLLKCTCIFLGIALLVCVAFLVRLHMQVYGIAGWRDEVYGLAGSRAATRALGDFHAGKLRLFELAGEQNEDKFSGRSNGVFEIWYPQFYPSLGEAHRYATEEFIRFYNDKMSYMQEHPEKFQPNADSGANNAVEPTRALVGARGSP